MCRASLWRNRASRAGPIAVALGAVPFPASAHSSTGDAGLTAGFMHPLTGPDHLLAMVAVGMVSVVLGRAAVWQVPAAFLTAMAVGATAGFLGLRVPYGELAVAASVLLLGLALMFPSLTRWRAAVYAGVVLFGFNHGHAHGVELPGSAAPLPFSFGFLAASLFLHVCGLFAAEFLSERPWQIRLRRLIGSVIAAAGASFVVGAMSA